MLALTLLFACPAMPAGADYEAGQRAWEAGQRDVAIAEWRASAKAGEAKAMLALGRLYLRGIGLPQNYVQAHKWFNLAASRGEAVAVAERDALVSQMTTQERAEAQKLALEWQSSEAPPSARTVQAPPGQSGASAEEIREVQDLLTAQGYQPGPADGVWGGQTTQALQAFLRDSGQPQPSTLTETLRLLRNVVQRPVVQRTTNTPFKDCPMCPEVIEVPAGSFLRGSPAFEESRKDAEGPRHEVTVSQPLAVGIHEVTFAEWDACVRDGGCQGYQPEDEGWSRGRQPVINVNWEDAQAYVAWLSEKTDLPYRLLSEAEWEYVARAGTQTPFHTGETITPQQANYYSKYSYKGGRVGPAPEQPVSVGRFQPNAFGLYDMHGNVREWVQDCWNMNYAGAPRDGQAWEAGDCDHRVARGGSWYYAPDVLRSASRERYLTDVRDNNGGFRVARLMTPSSEPQQIPPQPFTVVAEPEGARVRIVNIEESYRAGMALGPGAYEVEVSATGYTSVRETIEHGTEATERRVVLAALPPQSFTVIAEPSRARVRILNIEEPYQAGMALGPGQYEVEVSATGYEGVRETIRHGTEATERRIVLAAIPPQPFTVVAEPSGARVRILNIEEPYQAGMALGPGQYEVEVSATGYEGVRETIRHGTEATERRIVLAAIPPQPFTVVAEPSGARVRILNIEEPYQAGMALGPGQYEVEVSATGYEGVRETIRHGTEATERQIVLAAIPPQPFTVVTEPRNARVRILNIEEPYQAGMALGPGQYEVEVSVAGYETVRETIRHGTEATERRVELAAIPPQPFTVVAEPRGARIQIVNIEEPYQAGMALGPGAYEVEVQAAGYETVRETVEHGTEATERRVVLAALPPQLPPPSRESTREVTQHETAPLVQVPPRYPRRAARLQIEGFVTVEFTITPDGNVVEPVVVESKPPRVFDQAALQAIIQWRFEPRVERGQAVESRVKQRIEFSL